MLPRYWIPALLAWELPEPAGLSAWYRGHLMAEFLGNGGSRSDHPLSSESVFAAMRKSFR
jgi:hypothetical protein